MSEKKNPCDGCSQENCESCSQKSFLAPSNPGSHIKKVIAVVSGKGGVGKSLTTCSLAVTMHRLGYRVGVLDADITGPSVPKIFGVTDKAMGTEEGILPNITHDGIKIMSINLLLPNADDPVIWRGPVISGTVKQFWTDVVWGDLDYLFVDMPPGTGDVPLTVFQSLPVDGIVIVTSPQELVGLIVKKAFRMAEAMNIPVLGLIENMSYALCPDCGKRIELFGTSRIDETAAEMNTEVLAKVPVNPLIAKLCDEGLIETLSVDYYDKAAETLESLS